MSSTLSTFTQPIGNDGRKRKPKPYKPLPPAVESRSQGSKNRVTYMTRSNHSKIPVPPVKLYRKAGVRICAACLAGNHQACTGVACFDRSKECRAVYWRFFTARLAPRHTRVQRSKR